MSAMNEMIKRIKLFREREYFNRRISVLRVFGFDVVHGCQLRCIGCPNSTLAPKISFISLNDFSECLNNVDVKRVKLFRLFNFGEAFLHPDLPELVLQIPMQNWTTDCVEISTNGQVHDFNKVKEVFKTKVLKRLVVSCDGDGTAEEYERLRPPARWLKLIEFLSKVKELRDTYAPEIALMTRTICEEEERRRTWRTLLEPMGWRTDFREWHHLPQSLNALSEQIPPVTNRLCSFVGDRASLYVDADGTIIPCCVHPRADEFGNLKTSKFNAITKSKKYLDFIHFLQTNRSNHLICGECTF
jgi:radical SAM protein with 4Fe4S-binding SPASM domain